MTILTLKTTEPTRHSNPTAKATSLAYLLFERPDLDMAERFLNDFGLRTVSNDGHTLYLRAMDSSPWCYRVNKASQARFVGLGFTVATRAELEALSKMDANSRIETLEAPGGGEVLRMTDPSGFQVEVVFGRATVEAIPHREPFLANHDSVLPRINNTQRPPSSPAEVLRLGHVALEIADYQKTCAWYTQRLGLIPSDIQLMPDGSPGVSFMRLNLGQTPADHHTLALAQTFRAAHSHSAFEVVDVDAIGMGQQVLRERGWTHAWGMGRHILGSQIFDYWSDPWGFHHEHYCDGDVFTADHPTGLYPFSVKGMAQWGQTMPASFVKPKITWGLIKTLLRNLRVVPDVTLQKLLAIARSF